MRARDQSSIFSTGGKFRSDYGLLLELHTLTLVTRSYALLMHKPDSSTMPRPETIISTKRPSYEATLLAISLCKQF